MGNHVVWIVAAYFVWGFVTWVLFLLSEHYHTPKDVAAAFIVLLLLGCPFTIWHTLTMIPWAIGWFIGSVVGMYQKGYDKGKYRDTPKWL